MRAKASTRGPSQHAPAAVGLLTDEAAASPLEAAGEEAGEAAGVADGGRPVTGRGQADARPMAGRQQAGSAAGARPTTGRARLLSEAEAEALARPRPGRRPGQGQAGPGRQAGPKVTSAAGPGQVVSPSPRVQENLKQPIANNAFHADAALGPRASRIFSSASAYCEGLLHIRDQVGNTIPLTWNPVQRYIIAEKTKAREQGRPARFLIPKSRRVGVTTMEQAFSFALCANRRGQYAVTLADSREKSARIFEMATMFYDHIDPALRPQRKVESSKSLNFHKLGSQFFIGTAGSVAFGRGDTLQRVHGSEVAYWLANRREKEHEVELLIAGLTEATSHGEIVLESTSNGNSGWWYDTCMEAASNPTEWTVIFVPWFRDHNLWVALDNADEAQEILSSLDDREKWLMQEHGLRVEQIKWRRRKKAERAMRGLFAQEYPEILEESFLSSTMGYWDVDLLNSLTADVRPEKRTEDGVTFWADPEPDAAYILGADVAEGTPEGDLSAACVLHATTGEQVARLWGRWRPEEFAKRLAKLARYYNDALVGVERNNHGHSTLNTLQNVERYPRLYYEKSLNEKRRAIKKLGWGTDQLSRPIMLDDLREAMREGSLLVNDMAFLAECRTFENNGKGKYEARAGAHDDLVVAWSIAWQVRSRGYREARVSVF